MSDLGLTREGGESWEYGTVGRKEDRIYIAPLSTHAYSQSAQTWITQFCLQITTPCLPFLRKRSPDGATTTEAADTQLQLTTYLSTAKG